MLFAEQNFDFDIICKYFSGTKDSRYGDFQSLCPVLCPPVNVSDNFLIKIQNNFVNLTINDSYLLHRLVSFAQNQPCAAHTNYHEPKSINTEYQLFLFSIFINEIWQIRDDFHSNILPDISFCAKSENSQSIRRLAVMAFYLIEKDPLKSESLQKLYDTFSNELYKILTAGVLTEASPILKLLAICALKLSINIPAYQEV